MQIDGIDGKMTLSPVKKVYYKIRQCTRARNMRIIIVWIASTDTIYVADVGESFL